jgi:hypothetical protein
MIIAVNVNSVKIKIKIILFFLFLVFDIHYFKIGVMFIYATVMVEEAQQFWCTMLALLPIPPLVLRTL